MKILLVENSSVDAKVILAMLGKVPGGDIRCQCVQRLSDALELLSDQVFDVVLLDLGLPDSVGLETVTTTLAHDRQTPIIVLTGTEDEDVAVSAVQRGAQDFLVKGKVDPDLLWRSIRHAVQRKRSEREVLEAITREQQRIGQELHDGLGQELTGLSYLARSLARKLAAKSLDEAATADTIANGMQRALREVRIAVKGLTPVEVDAQGLAVALRKLAATTSTRCNVDCYFEGDDSVRVRDNDVATHLFRIAQEATNNAVKHARARHIVIGLESQDDCLRLHVHDDGVGVSDDSDSSGGMGLRIMRYRAGTMGAKLNVQSHRDTGTVVTCTLTRTGPHK
jgi:signal transduction histidine kinase